MTTSMFIPAALARFFVVLPAVVSGLWLAQMPRESISREFMAVAPPSSKRVSLQTGASGLSSSADLNPSVTEPVAMIDDPSLTSDLPPEPSLGAAIQSRKERIAQLLDTLDQVAGVADQMAPERAASLEPVLVDLAERTLDLATDASITKLSTDAKLAKIEKTVSKLVRTMNRVVEPEMGI